jgi:hypothetical protein
MSLPNSQLPSHTGSGKFRKTRKFIKRGTAKKARIEGKRYGENVSPRIKGYAD